MLDIAFPSIDTVTAAEAGVEVPMKNLDGITPLLNANKEPVFISLLGGDSKQYRAANRAMQRTKLEQAQRNRGQLATDEQLDEAQAEEIKLLAQMTTGWRGVIDSKGKEVPFTYEGAIFVYTRFPVIREQVDAAIVNRTHFIRPS
jgi:hypothetical protein